MKSKNLLFAAACLMAASIAQATVHTVDNNPQHAAQFSTISAAVAAAADYDTLLVQFSATNYGNLTLSKPLTIIGRGHNSTVAQSTDLVTVILTTGSAGSVMDGLWFNVLIIEAPNMVISNCRTPQIALGASASNVLVMGCVIFFTSNGAAVQISTSVSGVVFTNNFIGHVFDSVNAYSVISGGNSGTVFTNNVFVFSRGGGIFTTGNFFSGTVGSDFSNNVFYVQFNGQFNPGACSGCTFNNNLVRAHNGVAPAALGGTNLDNVEPTWNLGGAFPTWSYGFDYNMLSGTPLTGASDGGQVGIHGGVVSFNNNGYPRNIPRVTAATVITPVVPSGGDVQVSFSATQGQP